MTFGYGSCNMINWKITFYLAVSIHRVTENWHFFTGDYDSSALGLSLFSV